VQKVRERFAARIDALEERQRKRAQAIEVQNAQAREAKLSTAVSFGSTLLSALLGRRARGAGTVGRAATTARGVGRSMKESGDVERAEADLRSAEQQLADARAELETELESIQSEFDAGSQALEPFSIRPKKTGISIQAVVLAWAPSAPIGRPGSSARPRRESDSLARAAPAPSSWTCAAPAG
jgi:hypothetical protein